MCTLRFELESENYTHPTESRLRHDLLEVLRTARIPYHWLASAASSEWMVRIPTSVWQASSASWLECPQSDALKNPPGGFRSGCELHQAFVGPVREPIRLICRPLVKFVRVSFLRPRRRRSGRPASLFLACYTATLAVLPAFAFALSWSAACFAPTPLVNSPTGVESMGEVFSVPGFGSKGVTSRPSPPLISDSTITNPFAWFHGPAKSLSPYWLSPVEALKYWSTSRGVGSIMPTENCGFSILSRAAVNARMWVISRVIKNCSACFEPLSCVKLMRRS